MSRVTIIRTVIGFFINLVEAVAIVLVVLALSMGLRMGLIIGANLILTIVGTFLVMSIWGIDLQRMSLGALIIAMGMMVDNSIVVADAIFAKFQAGMDRTRAAIEAATAPSLPLLGATVIASMAFYPIFASPMNAGEYCRTLFIVVAISLILSWLLAVTFTPLCCIAFLKVKTSDGGEQYGGKFYNGFRRVLGSMIKLRWLVVIVLLAMLVAAGVGFQSVSKTFFPDSPMKMFMVDYWAPEGTRIEETAANLEKIESMLAADERVEAVTAFIEQGPPRFYLPVEPEAAYSSYGQLVVRVRDFREIDEMFKEFQPWSNKAVTEAMVRWRKFAVGPGDTFKIEARFIGPADADPAVLRRLGEQGLDILRQNPNTKDLRTDWRQRTKRVIPQYNQDRGRWSRVSRSTLARATRRAYDGYAIGVYREEDKLLPIILRNTEDERADPTRFETIQIRPPFARETVPLSQVADSVDVQFEDPIIWRWDRRRAITVQCDPYGVTGPTLREQILDDFENIDLPPGYTLMWDGQYKSTKEGQDGLKPGMPPVVLVILLTLVALFNSLRQPFVILCVIPFAAVGVTGGLLIAGAPFGFLALLGAGSLVGMMIKNAIVLIDQINVELGEGKGLYDAIVESTVARLRPVMLAAATTVLGVIPLLQDVFWFAMAVTIMFGLAFGTILTMMALPVFYAILFRVKVSK